MIPSIDNAEATCPVCSHALRAHWRGRRCTPNVSELMVCDTCKDPSADLQALVERDFGVTMRCPWCRDA